MKRLAGLCCALLLGCASTKKVQEAPRLPAANPVAVSKLSQGVEAASASDGRKRAIGLLEEAVKADGALWEARYNLGLLYADGGNLAAAERELTEAQKLAPDAEDVAIALSEVRRRQGDPTSAIQALDGFVQRHPEATVAPVALMAALREGGRIDAAIELAHRVLVKHSRDPYVLAELALAHLDRGEVDTAEILVHEALKADAKSAVAERTAGLIALKQGDDALSFQHFARATELDPNDTTARLNIATVLLQAGVYDRAAKEFRAAHEADPEDVAATLGLAAALRGQAKKDDANAFAQVEKLLLQVLDKQPDNLSATFNLALLYSGPLKRPKDAMALFQRFLDNAPKSHPARADAEKALAAGGDQAASASAPAAAAPPAK
jgi:tetratricopeptide (TPR) repeat protein